MIGWVIHGISLCAGLLISLLVHLEHGTLPGGSFPLRYSDAAAIALAAGAIVTLVCRRLAGQTERLRRTRTAGWPGLAGAARNPEASLVSFSPAPGQRISNHLPERS